MAQYSIEDLKGHVSQGGGLAKPNLYRVYLPQLPGFDGVTTKDIDLLCTQVTLPGRQIMTQEITIGTAMRKVASGYATTEMAMTFLVPNNMQIKKYFEYWQSLAHNQQTYEVGYYYDYVKSIKIEHLRPGAAFPVVKKKLGITKKIPSFIKNRLPTIGPFDLGQDELNLSLGGSDTKTYQIELLEAFPVTMQDIQLGNALEGGFMEVTVSFTFKDWQGEYYDGNDGVAGLKDSVKGAILNKVLDLIF